MTQSAKNLGRVCLVGAGPGDAGLITVAGLERLRRAEVVVFDALANPALLKETPREALRIDVGKRAGQHKLDQDGINALLLEHAQQGRYVVRLKGGDPYLFGRGAEEAAFLGRYGIEVEVIPGVTSGIAAPALAGIPVTHRELASTVTLITGHEDPTKAESSIDYASLAGLVRSGGTACFYMGVGRLAAIAAALRTHGLPETMPAAVIQWGTTPRQRAVRATLGTVADAVMREGLGAPAIVVIGAVAGLAEPGLDGFVRRPLFGQTVLVTRTRQQASALRRKLEEQGAVVIEAPTIRLVPPPSWEEVDEALLRIREFDWLILTSGNGVEALAERMDALGLDARHFAGVRIAVVGDATASTLMQRLSLTPDLVPGRAVAESLAAELIEGRGVKGGRYLLLRADIARPVLPETLIKAGAQVTELAVYETQLETSLPPEAIEALREKRIDWVTFTSASTARNLVELLGTEAGLLAHPRLASIGPVTSEAMCAVGLTPTIEADESNIDGLVEAIVRAGRR